MKKIIILISLVFLIAIPAQAENSIRNENQTTLYATEADTGPMQSVDRFGNLQCSLRAGTASATNPIKLEDSAHTSGDAGVLGLAVNNRSQSVFSSTNGDYVPVGVGDYGEVSIMMSPTAQTSANSAIQAEDAAFGAGSGVVVSGGQAVSAIAQTVGTTGDVAPPSMDLGNRLVTTNAPAGEMWYACSDAETGTSTNAIKAAVASNRMYVTSLNCSNNSAVPSQITFLDSVTAINIGSIPALANGGSYQATFPTPIRMAVNTQLGYIMTTTATSTTCCAAGYISTI